MTLEDLRELFAEWELVARWRELRAQGVPASSSTQEVEELRRALLDLGLWEEVYSAEITDKNPVGSSGTG